MAFCVEAGRPHLGKGGCAEVPAQLPALQAAIRGLLSGLQTLMALCVTMGRAPSGLGSVG